MTQIYVPPAPLCPGCGVAKAEWDVSLRCHVCCARCRAAISTARSLPAPDIPSKYASASMDDFPPSMRDALLRKSGGYRDSMLFYGAADKGKTHLLCAMAKDCHSRGVEAVFVTFREWCSELRRSVGDGDVEDVKWRYMSCGALFMDDLLANCNGDFIARCLYELYDHRHCEGLPTYTTLNADDFKGLDILDDRLRWRMCEDGGLVHIKTNHRKG